MYFRVLSRSKTYLASFGQKKVTKVNYLLHQLHTMICFYYWLFLKTSLKLFHLKLSDSSPSGNPGQLDRNRRAPACLRSWPGDQGWIRQHRTSHRSRFKISGLPQDLGWECPEQGRHQRTQWIRWDIALTFNVAQASWILLYMYLWNWSFSQYSKISFV